MINDPVSPEHPTNAYDPIFLTVSGIVNDPVNFEQYAY